MEALQLWEERGLGLVAWPLSQERDASSSSGSRFGHVSLVNRVVLELVVGEEGLHV